MQIQLNDDEVAALQQPINGQGGFQSLLHRLVSNLDVVTGRLVLTDIDLEQLPRYAFDYGNGGWENRLVNVFGRCLGPTLGR